MGFASLTFGSISVTIKLKTVKDSNTVTSEKVGNTQIFIIIPGELERE